MQALPVGLNHLSSFSCLNPLLLPAPWMSLNRFPHPVLGAMLNGVGGCHAADGFVPFDARSAGVEPAAAGTGTVDLGVGVVGMLPAVRGRIGEREARGVGGGDTMNDCEAGMAYWQV